MSTKNIEDMTIEEQAALLTDEELIAIKPYIEKMETRRILALHGELWGSCDSCGYLLSEYNHVYSFFCPGCGREIVKEDAEE